MTLEIYNVLTRSKDAFEPLHEGRVNMYVCGPTVQDYPHVGHAKTYISFDVDGLDPVFAPGTGTPEVGGLTTVEAQLLSAGVVTATCIGTFVAVEPGHPAYERW